MKNRRPLYLGLGIFFFVAGIQFLVLGIVSLIPSLAMSGGSYGEKMYYYEPQVLKVEPLGTAYEGKEALNGFSFYAITFLIENRSDEEAYSDGPIFHFEGENGESVYEYFSDEMYVEAAEPLFSYESLPYLPARRSTKKTYVVEAAYDLPAIRALYRPNYDSKEKMIEIPLDF